MTYKEFMNSISRDRVYDSLKHHKHHIKPRCMFSDDTPKHVIDHPDNIIVLTFKEHYVAHELLALENPGVYKLAQAWHMMHTTTDGKYTDADQYSALCENFAKVKSEKVKSLWTDGTICRKEDSKRKKENWAKLSEIEKERRRDLQRKWVYITPLGEFKSQRLAAEAHGVSAECIRNWRKTKPDEFKRVKQ